MSAVDITNTVISQRFVHDASTQILADFLPTVQLNVINSILVRTESAKISNTCCSLVLKPLTNNQGFLCGRNVTKKNTKLETIRRGAMRMGLSYVCACGWAVEQGHLWCFKVLQSVWLRWGCPNVQGETV